MTSMEQKMEQIHNELDKKLESTTQTLQKSMFDFIKHMSDLKSSGFQEQEANSMKSDKSSGENSAGSKRPADHKENDVDEDVVRKNNNRRKSPHINTGLQQDSQIEIATVGVKNFKPILKPGKTHALLGKT